MHEPFAFYAFCSVAVICYTWYKYNTRNDQPRK